MSFYVLSFISLLSSFLKWIKIKINLLSFKVESREESSIMEIHVIIYTKCGRYSNLYKSSNKNKRRHEFLCWFGAPSYVHSQTPEIIAINNSQLTRRNRFTPPEKSNRTSITWATRHDFFHLSNQTEFFLPEQLNRT